MKGLIVSNATPIIAFSRINRLDLFRQITGTITIPQEVEKELYEHERTDVPALDRSNWIKVRKVKSRADVELLLPALDKGEAEVIVLSRELGAGLVIIDELTARNVAIMMGLPIIIFTTIALISIFYWLTLEPEKPVGIGDGFTFYFKL